MNRASSATGWVRNPTVKSPDCFSDLASSYELGWTSNPITGCRHHTPEGLCLGGMFPCYAWRLANKGRLRSSYLANSNLPAHDEADHEAHHADPFWPRFWPSRVEDLLKGYYGKPKGIFICDMGELFGDWIPYLWQDAIFHAIRCRPQHRFYLLTKQPQNLPKFSPFPENCWVGATATNGDMLFNALLGLSIIKASRKYISFEPLLGSMGERKDSRLDGLNVAGINQVIIGAQTKPYKPPQLEWVQEIVEAADKAGVPVFLKDNLFDDHSLGELELRQEMPNG